MTGAALVLSPAISRAAAAEPSATPGVEALEYAFRFASAIHADPKDMAKAQQSVILDYVRLGAEDLAAERAREIEGWRGAVAYADLAAALAERDRAGKARDALARAEAARDGIDGWERGRVQAHVAQALAALGNREGSEEIATRLAAADEDYAGRSVATLAASDAASGDYDAAMERLAALDGQEDLYVTWWRTVGYLAVAKEQGLTRAQQKEALAAARRSADGIDGWKKAEALQSLAKEFRRLEMPKKARECLETAESLVDPLPATMPIKAPLRSNLARSWAELGNARHARELLRIAESEVSSTQVIDRPAVLANLASGFHVIGDHREARRLFDAALESAGTLVNARPRALAVVAICRFLGRSEVPLDDSLRGRLDALYAGLGDPW